MSETVLGRRVEKEMSPILRHLPAPGTSPVIAMDWLEWKLITIEGTADTFIAVTSTSSESREPHWAHSPTLTGPTQRGTMLAAFDATADRQDDLAALEMYAEIGDERRFIEAAGRIDWSACSSSSLVRGVHLSLSAGAHLYARRLAALGARLYPDHSELRKMSRILAPPRVLRTDMPPDPSWGANRAWLSTYAGEYRGKWVALREGRLLAAATTVSELRLGLESTDGVLITKVY